MSETSQTIFRKAHNKENPYALISKSLLRDNRLSAKEIGIMAYLLSLPDHWRISNKELAKHFRGGLDSIKSGIAMLVKLGYIEKTQNRLPGGKFGPIEMLVHEEPIMNLEILATPKVSPRVEKPLAGKPSTENPPLVNTQDQVNTYSIKTDNRDVVVLLDEEMRNLGVTEDLRKKYLEGYSIDQIKTAIKVVKHSSPNNPARFFSSALSKGWKLDEDKKPNSAIVQEQTKIELQKREESIRKASTPESRKARDEAMMKIKGVKK